MEVLSEPYFTLIDLQEFKDEVTQVVGSISSQMVKFDLVRTLFQVAFLGGAAAGWRPAAWRLGRARLPRARRV